MYRVVFDMDGVLFDSERCIQTCWEELAEKWDLGDIHPMLHACLGVTNQECRAIILQMMGKDFPCDLYLSEVSRLFHARFDGRLPLKTGVHELIGDLRAHSVPLALASSTREAVVRKNLEDAQILDAFSVLVCGNMVTKSKPDPEIYLKACDLLGCAPENAFAIEDSFNGIRSAHAAGLRTIMVPDLLQPTGEIRSLCETVLPSLLDVRTYFHTTLDVL